MPKHPLPKALRAEAKQYVADKNKAQEYANAANRQKTKLRNAVKDHWAKEKLPIGSYLRIDGIQVAFEATSTEIIDPEKVLELFENGTIDRDQFLRMINIGKSEAKNVLGGDQVEAFTTIKTGKTADIRVETLPVENVDDEFIMENAKPIKSRRKVRRIDKGAETPRRKTTRRKIKTRIKR